MASTRNQLIVKLKEELDRTIALVVHARESLENELDSEWAQKKLSVDEKFLKKLAQLTASFNSLTESKIRLDKAEKAMERDMTLDEEREAVVLYLAGMKGGEAMALYNKACRLRKDPEMPLASGKSDCGCDHGQFLCDEHAKKWSDQYRAQGDNGQR